MERINLNEWLEEVVDERIYAWKRADGKYYLAVVEDNGDEFELTIESSKEDVCDYLKNNGLM